MGSRISIKLKSENQISRSETITRQDITGDHETHVFDGSEGELHNRIVLCEKNPGHTKFIPVNTFTLEHLPKGQRDNDLYKYIKAVADLTVKVNVHLVSQHRPEFWPGKNDPYPFHNMRERKMLRTGTGMIGEVCKYTSGSYCYGLKSSKISTQCWCRKCEHSDPPSNVWWEFDLYTATHVVFDDIEASHTNLRLFFNSKDSPLVIVDNVSVNSVNIEDDRCKLKCVTCDINVGDKLAKAWRNYGDTWWKVKDKYNIFRSGGKMNFIISHPHGCTKQVSIGHWIRKCKLGKYDKKLTYTTSTCPGSSGARVYCVGDRNWGWWWLYSGLVHSGTHFTKKYNYSGVGY